MIQGSCHCGNVKLSIPYLTDTGTTCTCSICFRYGSIWGYFTESQVRVEVKEGELRPYSHGDKLINFNHCSICGCLTHYTSTSPTEESRLAVNYRMFSSDIVSKMKVRVFDGADTWQFLE